MGEVQIFTPEHANGVASLYFRAARGQNRPPGETLPKYFSELHLSNPWASPEMPALVYLEEGKVVGTIGVVPRTMEFRGQPIVLATISLFMVDREYRKDAAALKLLNRALHGPQDLSWTDGASGVVDSLWSALRGSTASLYAFNWIRILRPFGTAHSGLDRLGGAARMLKLPSSILFAPADFLLSRMPVEALRPPSSRYSFKLVSAEELLECIQQVGWREPLRPSYSQPSFSWLMSEAAKSRSGNLRMLNVRNLKGALCGWLVYYASRGGAAFVLQIGVHKRDDFDNVLLALFQDAWEQGSVCVKGASIPQYLKELTDQYCIFRHPDRRVIVHSRNPELANAVRLGEAAITRLDGIGWLRFSRENWD